MWLAKLLGICLTTIPQNWHEILTSGYLPDQTHLRLALGSVSPVAEVIYCPPWAR